MIKLRLKASQTLILLVENSGTGENLPVGKKVKFEPWYALYLEPWTISFVINCCRREATHTTGGKIQLLKCQSEMMMTSMYPTITLKMVRHMYKCFATVASLYKAFSLVNWVILTIKVWHMIISIGNNCKINHND